MKAHLRRSKLFTPATERGKLEKAFASTADIVVVDLEDSVPGSQKAIAREEGVDFLKSMRTTRKEIGVRINDLNSPYWLEDLTFILSCSCPVDSIHLPKVEAPSDLRVVERILDYFEPRRRQEGFEPVGIVPYLETPLGLANANSIVSSSTRIDFVQFGAGDLFTSLGTSQYVSSVTLGYPRSCVVFAAASANVRALDTVFVNYRDLETYREQALEARRLGFAGKSCIHPDQVVIANEIFSPTQQEIARAREIVAASRAPENTNVGAFGLKGTMIDKPFIVEAERLLAALEGDSHLETS